jgi:hypothetical protein
LHQHLDSLATHRAENLATSTSLLGIYYHLVEYYVSPKQGAAFVLFTHTLLRNYCACRLHMGHVRTSYYHFQLQFTCLTQELLIARMPCYALYPTAIYDFELAVAPKPSMELHAALIPLSPTAPVALSGAGRKRPLRRRNLVSI